MKLLSLLFILCSSTVIWAHPHNKDLIKFDYTFEKNKSFDGVVNVNASLTNNSDHNFYFLSQSCNGLDYYISTTSAKAHVYILMHCNASWPRKISIEPKTKYEFKTCIKCIGQLKQLSLKLSLIQLSKAYVVDEKFISEIEKNRKTNVLLLTGPMLSIPK